MEIILLLVFYFWTIYAFLPAVISRLFGFKVFRRGRAKHEIALTFDDGPDPVYTPQLLDLLKEYGAKGTFFVVGENAAKYPDIIARIHEEGHTLGIHNYFHYSNWFMRPKTVRSHIARTSEVIEQATGVKPVYYRPPWGIMNVFDYANLGYLQIVLWTSMFGDWRVKVGADRMYQRMRAKLKPGQVFLLHDCGRTFGADREAPANTIAALKRILQDGTAKDLRFVGIDELIALTAKANKERKKVGPFKRAIVRLWMLYEKLFHVVFRLRPIGDGKSINYRIRKYTGPALALQNGETLRAGDAIMELHFENQMLYETGLRARTPLQIGLKIVREMENGLPLLAKELDTLPGGERVKALYGITMIYQGSIRLGFENFHMPRGLFSWMTRNYLKLLIRVIHPRGNDKVRDKEQALNPRILVMPRDVLLEWGSGGREGRKAKQAVAVEQASQ